jgi:hypothetical protein
MTNRTLQTIVVSIVLTSAVVANVPTFKLVVIDRHTAWSFVDGERELPELREFTGKLIHSYQVAVSGVITRDSVREALRSTQPPAGFVRCGGCGEYARIGFCENENRGPANCDPDR